MSRNKSKKNNQKIQFQAIQIETEKQLNQNKREFPKREFLHAFAGFLVALVFVGILYVAIDARHFKIALASGGAAKITLEDEAQTDAEAEYIVTEEQKKLAEENRLHPVDPQYSMKDMPQYVVFAFDGSRSLDMWEETRKFAKDMNAAGTPLHFTYFINPIYLLTEEEAKTAYLPPRFAPGESAIGYSDSSVDTIKRRQEIRMAQLEGNEIASHAVGHFNGADWSLEEWNSELTQFDKIFYDGHTVSKSSVQGFRAPALGQNENLFTVLKNLGYSYDTSLVGMAKDLPKHHDGLWEFPVATIIFGRDEKPVLSMDYSIYMHQTGAKSIAVKGGPLWQTLYDETMFSYQRYFDENYTGNHAPVYIAHHFSKWNDGVYWQVMQDFAKRVCGKPNVKCVTYRELQQELEKNLDSQKTQ